MTSLEEYQQSEMFKTRIAGDPIRQEAFVHFVRSGMDEWVSVPRTAVNAAGVVVWRFTEWHRALSGKVHIHAADAALFTRFITTTLGLDMRDAYVCYVMDIDNEKMVLPYILDRLNGTVYDVLDWDLRVRDTPIEHALAVLPNRFVCFLFILNGAPRCVGAYTMNRRDFV